MRKRQRKKLTVKSGQIYRWKRPMEAVTRVEISTWAKFERKYCKRMLKRLDSDLPVKRGGV